MSKKDRNAGRKRSHNIQHAKSAHIQKSQSNNEDIEKEITTEPVMEFDFEESDTKITSATRKNNLDETERAAGFDRVDYFDDDEKMLNGDDKLVHESDDVAVFEQMENIISWEVENYYKDDGKPRNRFSLRNDPPVLKVSDSNGDSASFVITREFSGSLSKLLADIERSYYGVSEKRTHANSTSKDRLQDFTNFVKRHAILFILGGLILGVSLFSMFFMN